MEVADISRGGDIELDVKCNGKFMNFRSDVVLIKNNSILITSIKVDDQTVGFSDNCQINFLYKSGDKLYIWENVDIKLVKFDGTICHKIDLIGEGKPYNRRNCFRMYIGEEMPLYINTATGPTAISVLVKDISETGIGFITKEELDIDRTFRLKLKDNSLIINLSGIIVRKEYLDNLHSNLYGCKFNEKNNLLSKYIVKKQGEQLKKRSLQYSSPFAKEMAIK